MITLDFPRQIGKKRTTCLSARDFKNYVDFLGDKSSCYTSLYGFKRLHEDGRPDYSTAIIDRAWWDFDLGKNGVTIEGVKDEVCTLIQRIYADHPDSDVRVVATGRGFHVHQMFNESISGVKWSAELQRYEAYMGRDLKSLDGIGYSEKLTRIPGTYNPSRKRWAVVINPKDFISDVQGYTIPKHPINMEKDLCPFFGIPVPSMAFSLVKWVNDHPQEKKAVKAHSKPFTMGIAGEVPLPPCINSLIKQPNPEHKARIFLVSEMAYNMRWFCDADALTAEQQQEIEDSICDFISTLGWLDYNPSVTRKAVKSCLSYNPPSCRTIERRGWCHGSCWRDDGSMG